ncbi:MAG: DMT family transporter [Firmicutes bacterium]|nr:DMT family transporter [Bacillota bacterium]
MKNKIPAYLCLAAAMAIAGSSVVVGKILTLRLPVFLIACGSLLTALLVLLPLTWRAHKGFPRISISDLKILSLQAFTGIVLFRVFFLYGLRMTSAVAGGIITSVLPAVVGLISFLFLKEKLEWRKISGILFAVAGVLTVNTIGLSNTDMVNGSIMGNLLVLLAVVGEALFVILQKKVSKEVSPLTRTTLVSLFGFIFFLPLAVYEGLYFDFALVSWPDCVAITYSGVVVTGIAYILFFKGALAVPATTIGVFGGFMPISSVLLSSLILGETLLFHHLLSLGLVLAGIGLISTTVEAESLPANGRHQPDVIYAHDPARKC